MAIEHIYISDSEEQSAPPSQPVLKVSAFTGGFVGGDPSKDYMEPIVYLQIGEYDESTYENHFVSDRERQVGIHPDALLAAIHAVLAG